MAGFLILTLTGGRLPKNVVAAVGAGSIGLAFLVATLASFELISSGEEYFTQTLWTWMAVGDFLASFSCYANLLSQQLMPMYLLNV